MKRTFAIMTATGMTVALCASITPANAVGAAPASAPIAKPGKKDVMAAVDQFPALIRQALRQTGIPGLTAAVVYKDKVVYKGAFGVRSVKTGKKVTTDTVFQVASVSKPVGASAVAAAIGDGPAKWDDPIVKWLPNFALSEGWVGRHATVGDLYAHRSGLPGDSGNTLEAFGFDRATIIERLRFLPLAPFRDSYDYNNFGLTTAGEAVSRASGMTWDKMTRKKLFKPLGMKKSTYSYAQFRKQSNRATLHQQVNGKWVIGETRDADAQAPAGGLSSTVGDLAKWLRMEMAQGKFNGERVVKRSPLRKALTPQIRRSSTSAPQEPGQFYGFGMNVQTDSTNRQRWDHSGAFTSGAATNVMMIPELKVGVVVLTNGWPLGVPEALAQDFGDLVEYGQLQQDWLAVVGPIFAPYTTPTYTLDGEKKPKNPKPAKALSTYAGDYANDYFGTATVTVDNGKLVLRIGPNGVTRIPLKHWDGDVFYANELGMPKGFYAGYTFGDVTGSAGSLTLDGVTNGESVLSRVLVAGE